MTNISIQHDISLSQLSFERRCCVLRLVFKVQVPQLPSGAGLARKHRPKVGAVGAVGLLWLRWCCCEQQTLHSCAEITGRVDTV